MLQGNIAGQYKDKFFSSTPKQIIKDIFGGVIVALISIPISMGYAQIAGLPMQYGLYGSVFTILFFGLLTTSKDFVFGVDAAPAALVGGAIASMGITAESSDAMAAVPTITMFVALWLLLFYIFKAGRVVQYISSPVMGGFVTGICCTIILMQMPKLFGGAAGTGEAPELIVHIIEQTEFFHPLALLLGLSTIALIMLGKKFIPKVPVSVIVMLIGAMLTIFCHVDEMGVKLLPHVDSGFEGFHMLPVISDLSMLSDYLFNSLSVAVVILAESLLASKGNALKDGYKLDNNREVLAYSVANFSAALTGCCPVNASVSRTGIVRQFGAKSQWLSVSAALTMLAVLYFATPVIEYLPVPVLTAIVVSALINACEFHEAKRLWEKSRNEFYIFMGAFLSVLFFGTVAGVMIGVVLSFVAVVIRAVTPPRAFMGVIKGKDGFYSLGRNSEARTIKNTIIYRFGGNLFFANIDTFQSDIESAVTPDTKYIIVNAGAVGNIDITAADRLLLMYEDYEKRGIRFYITEHVGEVNDMLRQYGAGRLLKSGAVRMTTALALRDAGLEYPYPLEKNSDSYAAQLSKKPMHIQSKGKASKQRQAKRPKHISKAAKGIQPELEWVLGKDSGRYMDRIADELIEELFRADIGTFDAENFEKHMPWGRVNYFDEDELIDRLEFRIFSMLKNEPEKAAGFESLLEQRREEIESRMLSMDPHILERLKARRMKYAETLKKSDPAAYERLQKRRTEYIKHLDNTDPELAKKYREAYMDVFTGEDVHQ